MAARVKGVVARTGMVGDPRSLIWAFHMALPLLGLWLLLVRPDFDVAWEDHSLHLVIVGATAAVSVGLALAMGRVAAAHSDARLTLVSLAFLASAAAFLVHALTTPAVVIANANLNFLIATPVGLAIGSLLALISAADLPPDVAGRVLRVRRQLTLLMAALVAAWLIGSFVPPLSRPAAPGSRQSLLLLAVPTALLYLVSAAGYYRIYRRRRSVMPISLMTAFALLAEAVIAIPLADNWHASWWEWHVLMTLAYGFVVYSARANYREAGSVTLLFRSIGMDETIRELERGYRSALEAFVGTLGHGRSRMAAAAAARASNAVDPVAEGAEGAEVDALAMRFHLTEGQRDVLREAAKALALEREQVTRLDALASVGRSAAVELTETALVTAALERVAPTFAGDSLSFARREGDQTTWIGAAPDAATVLELDRLAGADEASGSAEPTSWPAGPEQGSGRSFLPVEAGRGRAGILVAIRPGGYFDEAERALLQAFAAQLAIAIENVRLYRRIEGLFRSYISPAVATTLLSDPERARLGGTLREVSVLFADLRGYTAYSERADPSEIVEMLNRYFGVAVPAILSEDGTVLEFMGDAVMAVWNAPLDQPDHALRAARTALALQRVSAVVAREHESWPRFRVGIETGRAVAGNVGSSEIREYTVIGDPVNLAARLQSLAGEGEVVLGPGAIAALGDRARTDALGTLEVKGKREPIAAWRLRGLAAGSG